MFEGFRKETLDFLWGIRFNNNREWFEENKKRYQEDLYIPMRALAFSVWEDITRKQEGLQLNCHVSRIYRDARRTHGKGPYKDRLWFSLRRDREDWTDTPVFYFELSPEGYCYGLGYYAPRPATLERFRASIDADPAGFERLALDLQRQKIFVPDGEEYKKKKGEKTGVLALWYNRKNPGMTAWRELGDELYSSDFAGKLAGELSVLIPLYLYLKELDGGERLPEEQI
jgi:uncharacterized protein (TIGR02453 family)